MDDRRSVMLLLSSYRSALRWKGSPDAKLIFRGQLDTTGPFPRALTIVVGQPLKETMCKVGGVDFCTSPPRPIEVAPGKKPQDLSDPVADAMESRNRAGNEGSTDIRFRLHCAGVCFC